MQKLGSDHLPGGLPSTVEQQRLVDIHFRSSANYWRNLYESKGVFEVIHQQRRSIVLGLLDELGLAPGSHILEIGCGAGLTTIALAQRGYNVHAMDAVERMLALTREAAADAGVADRVITSIGDAHSLAFPDRTFSIVIGMGVAPWLHSLNTAIRECARVLRPGGYLIFTTDNRWRLNDVVDPLFFPPLRVPRLKLRLLLERLRILKPREEPRSNKHSIKQFDGYLAAAGLEKIKGMTLGFGPFTCFKVKLLSDSLGTAVHNKLQSFADRKFPLLQSCGRLYIPVARNRAVQDPNEAAAFQQSDAQGATLQGT